MQMDRRTDRHDEADSCLPLFCDLFVLQFVQMSGHSDAISKCLALRGRDRSRSVRVSDECLGRSEIRRKTGAAKMNCIFSSFPPEALQCVPFHD